MAVRSGIGRAAAAACYFANSGEILTTAAPYPDCRNALQTDGNFSRVTHSMPLAVVVYKGGRSKDTPRAREVPSRGQSKDEPGRSATCEPAFGSEPCQVRCVCARVVFMCLYGDS